MSIIYKNKTKIIFKFLKIVILSWQKKWGHLLFTKLDFNVIIRSPTWNTMIWSKIFFIFLKQTHNGKILDNDFRHLQVVLFKVLAFPHGNLWTCNRHIAKVCLHSFGSGISQSNNIYIILNSEIFIFKTLNIWKKKKKKRR